MGHHWPIDGCLPVTAMAKKCQYLKTLLRGTSHHHAQDKDEPNVLVLPALPLRPRVKELGADLVRDDAKSPSMTLFGFTPMRVEAPRTTQRSTVDGCARLSKLSIAVVGSRSGWLKILLSRSNGGVAVLMRHETSHRHQGPVRRIPAARRRQQTEDDHSLRDGSNSNGLYDMSSSTAPWDTLVRVPVAA